MIRNTISVLRAWLWGALWLIVGLAGCVREPSDTQVANTSPPDEIWSGRIVLGSASLTAGIPGQGPLTLAEIRTWLADPENHRPLQFALPLGLRSETPPSLASDNPLTRAKIELGRQLFSDRRLSRGSVLACIDCHHPQRQFTSDEIGHARLRETAVVFNRILSQEQFWDGRAKSLEDQIHFPLENEDEFNTTQSECVERIKSIEGYRLQFDAIFGELDYERLCQAIAAFERALVTGPSAWDYDVELRRLEAQEQSALSPVERVWLSKVREAVHAQPLSEAARRGADLFFSERGTCSRCHSGPNFTDEEYYDIGLRPLRERKSPIAQKEEQDFGRFHVTGQEPDRHKFKTPTLRNVALTWPYLHDGRFTRLEQVVDHFIRGGEAGTSDIQALDLNPSEASDLVAFLKSLTGPLPQPPTERLPP